MAAPASVTSRLMYFPLPRLLNRLHHQLSFPRTFHCTHALFIPSPPPHPFLHQPLFPTFVYIHGSCMRFLAAAPRQPPPLFPPPFREVFAKLFNFPVDSSRCFSLSRSERRRGRARGERGRKEGRTNRKSGVGLGPS